MYSRKLVCGEYRSKRPSRQAANILFPSYEIFHNIDLANRVAFSGERGMIRKYILINAEIRGKGVDAMTRDEAKALLKGHVKNGRMLDHSYASEAVLRALARRLGRDEEKWGLAGLLHDIDIEAVGGDLTRHGWRRREFLAMRALTRRSSMP